MATTEQLLTILTEKLNKTKNDINIGKYIIMPMLEEKPGDLEFKNKEKLLEDIKYLPRILYSRMENVNFNTYYGFKKQLIIYVYDNRMYRRFYKGEYFKLLIQRVKDINGINKYIANLKNKEF